MLSGDRDLSGGPMSLIGDELFGGWHTVGLLLLSHSALAASPSKVPLLSGPQQ